MVLCIGPTLSSFVFVLKLTRLMMVLNMLPWTDTSGLRDMNIPFMSYSSQMISSNKDDFIDRSDVISGSTACFEFTEQYKRERDHIRQTLHTNGTLARLLIDSISLSSIHNPAGVERDDRRKMGGMREEMYMEKYNGKIGEESGEVGGACEETGRRLPTMDGL